MILHQQKFVNPWDLEYGRQCQNAMYKVELNNEIQHNINGLYLQDQFGISFEAFDQAVPSYAAIKKKATKPLCGLVNRACLRAVVDKIKKKQCFQENTLEKRLEKLLKEYTLTTTELGEGASGKVFLATRNRDWKRAAVKKINLNRTNQIQLDSGKILPKEVYFLNKVRDIDGCVKLLDYYIVGEECWITTEYHQNSITLTEFINKNEQLSENKVINIFKQITSIVLRLEMAGITHRDLKGDSILVDENENILVIDFGLAESLETADEMICGTPGYWPPEVDFCEFFDMDHVTGPVTTWSLGIILGSLLIGKEPFDNGRSSLKAKGVIDLGLRNRKASRMARRLVNRCLQMVRGNRPSVKQILQDPWLNLDVIKILSVKIGHF
jgi:serine/threonine protein kinase